ncbi:MAG: hypothetical protein K2N93_04600 [Alistipes sp.]|nr:hypothetical protein [Alistipes sp.]
MPRPTLLRVLGRSPEWTAALRRRPAVAAAVAVALLLCAALPWAGFPALLLAAVACRRLYRRNEGLQLLLLSRRSASRLLTGKILAAWRNYFGTTLPFALLAATLHPRTAWMAAAWAPLAALALAYAVLAKYARYDPREAQPRRNALTRTGTAGVLFPPLLPLTLVLTVAYALRAERNLDRYLHDYD